MKIITIKNLGDIIGNSVQTLNRQNIGASLMFNNNVILSFELKNNGDVQVNINKDFHINEDNDVIIGSNDGHKK